jgi:hypothetical protein
MVIIVTPDPGALLTREKTPFLSGQRQNSTDYYYDYDYSERFRGVSVLRPEPVCEVSA